MRQCPDLVLESWPEIPLPEWSDYSIGRAIDTYQRSYDSSMNVLEEPINAGTKAVIGVRLEQLRAERQRRMAS